MSVVKSFNQTNGNETYGNSSKQNYSGFTRKSDINHNPTATERMNSFSGTSKINPTDLGFQPKNDTQTFRVNPMIFENILARTDVDKLEEDFAKEIQRKKTLEEKEKREIQKILEESDDINYIKAQIRFAQMNKDRSLQIREKQVRKLNDIVKDAEIDEMILEKLEIEQQMQQEKSIQKKMEKLNSKYVIQNQMKDKEKLKEESRQEYLRDKHLVNDAVQKIIMEDLENQREIQRKKEVNKKHMYEAYDEKERRRQEQIAHEKMEREKERQYYEEVARRDKELQLKKAAIQEEKDKIFDKLASEEHKRQADKEYWENVRNELYIEENERREKIKELEQKEKKQRQKEEMLTSAIAQYREKEKKRQEEESMENEFKKRLMEKFAEDERLEQYNAMRRKQKEIELKKEIERQWQEKLRQYQLQKEQEIKELELLRKEEATKRELIQREKEKLIKEHEELLKDFFSKGYLKVLTK